MICPNCHRMQPGGAIECSVCGVIFAKFRARPGRVKRLEIDLPKHGPWMLAAGGVVGLVLVWAWFNPGIAERPSAPLTPGGEPVPVLQSPEDTPEQALARRLRAVEAEAVERVGLVLEPLWLEEGRLGVDQVRVVALLYTADDTVAATGRLDYQWVRGDERPHVSHTNLQALGFRRGEVSGAGRDLVHKELLRIDAPRETYEGETVTVEVTFDGRRSAEASLLLTP